MFNLYFTFTNGVLHFEDRQAVLQVLAQQQQERIAAEAAQQALEKVYTVSGLADRLHISVRSAYELLHSGLIRFFYAGQKNYRVTELAVREFTGDVKKQS